MGAQGTATIDFGASLNSEASVVVTGQAGILAGSAAEAFLQGDTTADNNATAHEALAFLSKCFVDTVVAGTGFTIRILMFEGVATNTFSIRWVWS